MKKTFKITLLILTVAMCISLFAACGSKDDSDWKYIEKKDTLVIGITDFEPMNFRGADGEWTGFDTEFAVAVCEKLGVSPEFIEIDWDNKILEVNAKSIDCVWNGMTLSEEVVSSMACTKAYINNAQVVVLSADAVGQYADVQSLSGLSFTAESGSAGESAIKDNGLDANYTAVATQADALLEVASGSSDACVIDITMAAAMTGEGTSYDKLAYSIPLTTEEYGIGFRKGSDMAAKVDKIIEELTADGTLQALGEKYDLSGALVANQ